MRRKRKHSVVELLESRRLLSISAASVSPPLTAGATWATADDDGTTDTITVIGDTTFMGHAVTKVQDVSNTADNTSTSLFYVGKDSANDIVFWGAHVTSSSSDGSSSVTDITWDSGLVELPAAMTAGQSQTFTTTSSGTNTSTDADGKVTTQSATGTEKKVITLVSSSTQTITVPAGTFKCYQVRVVDTTTQNGVSSTDTQNNYLTTGGLPQIKVLDTGATDTTTTVLTSFSGPRKPAAKLAIDTPPSAVKEKAAMTPAVQIDVDDADDGIVFDNTSTISLAVASGPTGGVMTGTTSVAAVQGAATFSGLQFSKAGTYTLTASDGSLTAITSQTFTVTPAGATKLEFGTQPSNAVAAKAIAPAITVKLKNDDGSIDTTNNSSVTLNLIGDIPVGASIGGTVTVAAVNGIATFDKVDINLPGTYTLQATDGSLDSATSNSFVISSAVKATKLGFIVQPATTVAGKVIAPGVKVAVETAGGVTVPTDHSTVTLTLGSGAGTLGGTLTAVAVNGIATFSNLSLTKTGAFTLSATDGTLTAATSNSFTITPDTASKLVFAATSATELAGKPISPAVVVDIEDKFGNIVTTSSAKVAMTIATGGGKLTGTSTVAAKAGVATFSNLVLSKLGKYTLRASAPAVTSATSGSFSVIPGVPTKLVLVKSPKSATAGKAISPALVIDIEDVFGNIVTSNTSIVKFTATGGGALTGTASVAAKAGIATFSILILDKAGKYTLKATDGALTAATTASFTVAPAAASKLVFAPAPSTATAGKAISRALVVDIEDAFGNIATTNTSKVTLGVSTGPTGGALTGNFAVAAKAGIATFSGVLIDKAGTYALKAADGALTAGTSSSIKVNPGAATKLVITSAPTTGTVATPLSPPLIVAVEDAFGNIVITNKSKVTAALSTSPAGSALGGTTAVSAVNGLATFDGLNLSQAGGYKLKVTDGSLASALTGTLNIT